MARPAAVLMLVATAYLLASAAWSAATIESRAVPSAASAELEGPAGASWVEEPDPEDGESSTPTRNVWARATCSLDDQIASERTRRLRPDRPPHLDPRV